MKNKQVCFSRTQNRGFSLIELLIVVTIVGMLSLLALYAFHLQVLKGRDAKRKTDLAKLQTTLEDYLNDNDCYPASLECNQDFLPYLSSVPCDPVNSRANIYYYSVSQGGTCKRWYKIFTTLESKKDPIIEKIGCTPSTCGPFNYLVASANVELLTQQLGEVYPPAPPGVPLPTPTPAGGGTPTPTPTSGGVTPTPTPTGGAGPTSTPTPTPTFIPTPTPTCGVGWFTCVGQGGKCNVSYEGAPGAVCSSTCNGCTAPGCVPSCLVQGAEQ